MRGRRDLTHGCQRTGARLAADVVGQPPARALRRYRRRRRRVRVIGHAFAPKPTWRQQQAWAEAPEELRWRLTVGAIADQVVQAAIDHVHRTVNDGPQVFGHCEPGRPVPVLLAMAASLNIDALVIGNRDMRRLGPGGSIGRGLTRRASGDVIVVDTVGRRDLRHTGRPPAAFRPVHALAEL